MVREETGTEIMFIALVLASMILGAVAGATWFVVGGSILLALGVYGLVTAFSVLAAASVIHILANERESSQVEYIDGLRATR